MTTRHDFETYLLVLFAGIDHGHTRRVLEIHDALVAAAVAGERERWKTLAKNHRTDRKGEYADGWNAALEVMRMWAPKTEDRSGAKPTRPGTDDKSGG